MPRFARRQVCLLAVLSLLAAINAALVVIISPYSGQYESWVLAPVSPFFWLFYALSIAFSLVAVSKAEGQPSSVLLAAVSGLITANAVLVAAPSLRGYPYYGGNDFLLHLGYVTDIVKSGGISSEDFYPLSHLFPFL